MIQSFKCIKYQHLTQTEPKFSSVNEKPFTLEKEIQNILESNTEEIFNLRFVTSEFSLDGLRFDSVCFNEETKSFVIIEYKKDSSSSVIDQGFAYLSTMLNNKADLILEYNETTEKTLKKNEVDWNQPRIIFISPSFTAYQKISTNFKDIPFELWEIKRFEGDLVSLNKIITFSKESVKGISSNSITKGADEIKTYDTSDLLSKTSQKTKDLWENISQRISKFEQGTFLSTTQGYIRFSFNDSNSICFIFFNKIFIRVRIREGLIQENGAPANRWHSVINDYKNLAKRIEEKWLRYEINGKKQDAIYVAHDLTIKDEKDIDYLIELINQRYEAFINS